MSASSSQLRRERRKRQQKRQQQLCTTQSKAATLPSVILQLVFDHLEINILVDIKTEVMFDRLLRLKELASVNRRWRSVAKYLLYRVAYIAARGPKHDVDDKGAVEMVSNVHLIRDVDEVNSVREVHIDMHGGMQILPDLGRLLFEQGLGASPWPRVERLQLGMLDSSSDSVNSSKVTRKYETLKAFNDLLSRALPSLNKIAYNGFCINLQNRFNPISPLIEERLYGPAPIRVLRFFSDCELKLNGRVGDTDAPIVLDRMCISYQRCFTNTAIPTVQANALVEFSFGKISFGHVWGSFVVDGAPGSPEGRLVFSRLESLTLSFNMAMGLATWMNALGLQDSGSYFKSARFGTPHFPVLTSLSINYFPDDLGQFLSLFASSPISKLTISGQKTLFPDDLDLSQFGRLRSLCLVLAPLIKLGEKHKDA
ncbi:hypothetical protein IW146_002395 [Coemansia sp. RSA 922]|nr:hypothetical protein GGH13_002077 [Coemansia sp. S155-1]KAJ2115335.1 hypothetical protein IW146_002395 [Coemansia sp. RSA 922]